MYVPNIERADILTIALAATFFAYVGVALFRSGRFPRSNIRGQLRFSIRCGANILWRDAKGVQHRVKARVRDISDSGASLYIRKQLQVNSTVFLDCPEYRITGAAYVRRCSWSGLGYRVGIKFKGVMRNAVPLSA